MSSIAAHLASRRRRGQRWINLGSSIGLGSILLSLAWQAAAAGPNAAGESSLRACRSDALRYCASLDRSGDPERACLGQYSNNLSRPCRVALDGKQQLSGAGDVSGVAR